MHNKWFRRGAWRDKKTTAFLIVPKCAITNFISPTCDYELNKLKHLTPHWFHMQVLTTTFLLTVILVACEAASVKQTDNISRTGCQVALSERQFGKQTHDACFVWSWRSCTKHWYWSLIILGTFSQDISFESVIYTQCPQQLRWRECMETPMFVGASQNISLVMPLYHWLGLSPAAKVTARKQ